MKKYVLSSVYAAIVGAHVAGVAGYVDSGIANVAVFAFMAMSVVLWVMTVLVVLSPREKLRELVEGVVHEKGVEATQHSAAVRTAFNTLYFAGALALAYHGAFAQAAILVGLTICIQAAQTQLDAIEAEVLEDWT